MRAAWRTLTAGSAAAVLALLGAATVPAGAASTPRVAPPGCPWVGSTAPVEQRVSQLLAQMTLDDKILMVHGGEGPNGKGFPWTGIIAGNIRLCIPELHLMDGPGGVGTGFDGVTELPAPVSAAATFDTGLERQYGDVVGAEVAGKGAHVNLGPTVNLVRDPRWGRAFETMGEDAYLAGQMGAAYINGVQSNNVMSQVKHIAVYNQESNRNSASDNVIIDDRTLQEIYLPQFNAAITQGGAASTMCSYAWINGQDACENDKLLNQILKGQWGFQGFVTSDWFGTHSTAAAANNGLDMEQPNSDQFFAAALKTAVTNGQVPQSRLDDMVRRILRQMFRFGVFDRTLTGNPSTVVTNPQHAAVARTVATEGTVLLKNANAILPLDKTKLHSLAVIGAPASTQPANSGGGSAGVSAPYVIKPLDAIKAKVGSGVDVKFVEGDAGDGLPAVPANVLKPSSGTGSGLTGQYFNNMTVSGSPVLTRNEAPVDFTWTGSPGNGVTPTQWSAKWTGTLTPPTTGTYTFAVSSDDGSRLFINGNKLIDNWRDQGRNTQTGTIALTAGQPVTIEADYYQNGGDASMTLGWSPPGSTVFTDAVNAARSSDAAVVFVSNFTSEGGDLSSIDLPGAQNQLISAVAAANPKTIVVVQTGSAVTMPWIDQTAGVLEAWYNGQEDGNATADLLFGDANPSGKLPVTFPRSLNDVPAHTQAQWPGANGQVRYSEGLKVGYRWYDAQNIAPLFPFGFGMSYTTFSYANLTVSAPDSAGNVAVGFDVTNTGTRAGAEVAQVYVAQPPSSGEPPKNLRGFQRVSLNPGQTRHVTLTLDARSFQTWTGSWTNTAGSHRVEVGSSSRDIRLTGQVTIGSGGGQTPLPRTGWTATASVSSTTDVPARMLDAAPATRWTTGTPMVSGQTVTVDMGAVHSIDKITMDSADSTNDFARGYQVNLSTDGVNWGSPVANGTGTAALVTATFPAQSARFIRVTQTGSSSFWWSIAEFNAYS
jgi:beta-glucosidase